MQLKAGLVILLAVGFVFVLFDQLRYPCFTIVSPPGSVLTPSARSTTVISSVAAASAAKPTSMPMAIASPCSSPT